MDCDIVIWLAGKWTELDQIQLLYATMDDGVFQRCL